MAERKIFFPPLLVATIVVDVNVFGVLLLVNKSYSDVVNECSSEAPEGYS